MKKLFIVLLSIVLTGAIVFSGCASQAPAPSPTPAPAPAPAPPAGPIKIGLMFPLTGPLAIAGELMLKGAQFAFEQAGHQVAGRKIEAIVADSGGETAQAIDKSRKLVEHDKVSMLIGPAMTHTKLAVGDYMAKAGIPHLAPHFNELVMSQRQWSFMAGGSSEQLCGTMGTHAYKVMGLKTLSVLTVDASDGREFYRAFKQGYEKAGGKIIQEQYAPRPCPDFAPFLVNLKDADAVAAWFVDADSIRFFSQYHEFGIRQRMPVVAIFHGSFLQMFILNALQPEAANATVGEQCATTYTPFLETEVNKKYAADFKQRFGQLPEQTDAGSYMVAQIALKALEATGGDTAPEKLRQAILGVDFESPEGRIRFDPQTRFLIRDVHIVKIDKVGGELTLTVVHTYKDVPPGGL